MLDLGTGSGILAIAAARQGAAPVLALDIDPVAVEAAQANIARNGVAEQVQAGLVTDLARLGAGRFGLIAANIIADVLMDYAAELRTLLAPGGILLSSGIILDREDEVALTYASQGLQQRERQREGEWIAFVHQAPAHTR
jgi:ribosomal protein L11 methyltransferase